ncbi:MAG: peptidase C14 [Verrucomicrobia bacterium]|nr:peptidase C14 [Verrucomicrobiota bacterium]
MTRRFKSRLNLVAEGDSWFAYPRKWILTGKPNNIIDHLKMMRKFNLLQLSSSGDEAVQMLSGDSKIHLLEAIHDNRVDTLLFSGGGNDLVGQYDMLFFLNDGAGATSVDECLNLPRLRRRLAQIENAYRDLIEFCDEYSKKEDIVIVTHTYDYAKPDDQGAEFLGGLYQYDGGVSWMWPYMQKKRIPVELRQPIVDRLINSIAELLISVEQDRPDRISVVDTRGTLDPGKDWLNEIHPNSRGFRKIAEKIFTRIEQLDNQ